MAAPRKNEITDEDRQPGVVYIGHVPHGFYEKQLQHYFSQFGKVTSIKLSRSKKNGKSKGYAFVKFQYAAVAKTVAETCHNYLFFNKLLKCEYKPLSEVHPDTFFSYKWRPNKKNKRVHNSDKTEEKLQESFQRSARKRQAKLDKLRELGVDLKLDEIVDIPKSALKPAVKSKRAVKDSSLEDAEEAPLATDKPAAKTKVSRTGKKDVKKSQEKPVDKKVKAKLTLDKKSKNVKLDDVDDLDKIEDFGEKVKSSSRKRKRNPKIETAGSFKIHAALVEPVSAPSKKKATSKRIKK